MAKRPQNMQRRARPDEITMRLQEPAVPLSVFRQAVEQARYEGQQETLAAYARYLHGPYYEYIAVSALLGNLFREIAAHVTQAAAGGDLRFLANYLQGRDEDVAGLMARYREARLRLGDDPDEETQMLAHSQNVLKAIQAFNVAREQQNSQDMASTLNHLQQLAAYNGANAEEMIAQLRNGVNFGGRVSGPTPGTGYILARAEYNRTRLSGHWWKVAKAIYEEVLAIPEGQREEAHSQAYATLSQYFAADGAGSVYCVDKQACGRWLSNLVKRYSS